MDDLIPKQINFHVSYLCWEFQTINLSLRAVLLKVLLKYSVNVLRKFFRNLPNNLSFPFSLH